MESKRQKKFSRLIQKDLGDIFLQKSATWFHNAFVTVTQAKISPDLREAKVYLSFMNAKDKEELLEHIQDNTKTIRQELAQRIKNQVRSIPVLHFFYDDTEDVAAEVETLFKDLDIPPAASEDEKE
ncbi:30S ribosome-binding factor RbfA [Rapidithrix thailandica]|uniref:Ribosome-binding factor A n=1 Tax=Rapidithrix thailandica TaxID=413964 RepID=A0AAW9SE04_9BACT